ncbi:MAG: aminoacyltransferase [Nanoarchaeota archaeon]|nr:aminoacyltransferase [Nanoarchaeota archaeon]
MGLNNVPENWNLGIEDPFVTKEFGEASKFGGEVYYVKNGEKKAIIVIKKKYISLFSRANIFTNSEDKSFLEKIISNLKRKKIPYARIGNTMVGPEKIIDLENSKIIERHTFILDLKKSEKELWANFDKKLRNSVRKAEKEGILVSEIKNENELEAYYNLSLETEKYIKESKGRKTFSLQDYSFFKALLENKLGRFFIAKYGGEAIAGVLFLVWGDKSIYFHSCLSREHSSKQAPSLIQWTSIKELKRYSIKEYDLGGITIGLDRGDSRFFVYEFKKKFGGKLKEFYNIEVELSRFKKVQDSLIKLVYGK